MMIDIADSSTARHQPVSCTLTLPCATTLNIVCWGHKTAGKPVCLLLHGLDNNARIWDQLACQLSESFCVYAIDFRGHGESGWAGIDTYTVDHLVMDIENVRRCLQLDTFYLTGHSLGGRVAARYTAQYPQHISALVMCDIGPDMNELALEKMRKDHATSPQFFNCRASYYQYLTQIYMLADTRALQQFALHSVKEHRGRYYNKTDPQCKDAILRSLALSDGSGCQRGVWHLLPDIKQPVLLLRGAYSAVLSETDAKRMLGRLPDGRLATVHVAGHALMIDNPTGTVQEIGKFLSARAGN